MTIHCPTCQCDVIARWNRCPWCNTRITLTTKVAPRLHPSIQLAVEAVTLMHLTEPRGD